MWRRIPIVDYCQFLFLLQDLRYGINKNKIRDLDSTHIQHFFSPVYIQNLKQDKWYWRSLKEKHSNQEYKYFEKRISILLIIEHLL